MKGKQCLTNLKTLYDEMTVFLDEGKAVHVVYLSFSKDFVIIFYDLLIDKPMKCELDKWAVEVKWKLARLLCQKVWSASQSHVGQNPEGRCWVWSYLTSLLMMGQSSPSVYSPVMQKWKKRLLDQMVFVPFTGNRQTGTSWNSRKGNAKSCTWQRLRAPQRTGGSPAGKQLGRNIPGNPGDQQVECDPEMSSCNKENRQHPDCISENVASRSRADPAPLLSIGETTSGILYPVLSI